MLLSGEMNIAIFDLPWSAVHFASGLLVGLGLRLVTHHSSRWQRWWIGVAVLAAWEIFEYGFVATGWADPESIINIFGDILIGAFGVAILVFRPSGKLTSTKKG